MSISSVVTRGYGTWSTVNKLTTWGYGIRAAVVDGITTRLTLRGTAMTRLSVSGQSAERMAVQGTSEKRLSLRGPSEP